ncbi:MAG: GAF domain-containing sensor histidine kinase [Chloroflexi bacterium]|nr:MAG: GAF domain-containing sensor histidine kinase [Chloroflexota bacterium]
MPRSRDRDLKLLETGLALSSELSLPALLQRIVDLAVEVTDARYGALGVLGSHGNLIDFLTAGVTPQERAAIGHLPEGRGILGVLIDDARALRLHNIADDPRSVGFPSNHPPMRSFLGAPVRARGQVFGNIYLTEKAGGGDFTAEDEASLEILATQAGVAIANARLYEETRQRERWLEVVREITGAILRGSADDAVLRLVARRARELVAADLATVVTPDDDTSDLRVVIAEGTHAEELQGMPVPSARSVSGDVIRGGTTIVLVDAVADERTYQPMVSSGMMGPSVFVPISLRGRTFGTLSVANMVGGLPFGDADVRLVESIADQASLGLEYGRAQRELARLALVEDRERIAKELHDGVIQALFAVGLGLQGTAALIAEPKLATRVQDAVNELDHVIGDLRNYIFGLRPGVLVDGRIGEALLQLGHDFEARTGVVTVVDVDASLEEPLAPHATDVVQLAREALSNVGRHAGAMTCRVSLRRQDGRAILEIDDDGSGFDVSSARPGLGLGNLRQRAAGMGGELEIQSTPADGTAVRVSVPL